MNNQGPHLAALARFGLPPEQAAEIGDYLDLLAVWSRRVNLTGAHSPEERVRILVEPVLPAVAAIDSGPLVDIGSGNGSPGLVLAAVRPDLGVVLLEPRQKRWVFLVEAARGLRREKVVSVVRARYQDYMGPPAGALVSRGLRVRLREIARLVRPGGQVLAFGGSVAPEPPFCLERTIPVSGSSISVFRRARFT